MANRIPRNFKHMLIEALTQSNAGNPGEIFEIVRDATGYHGTSLVTGKEWTFFPSMIRNENLFKIVEVV